MTTDMQDAVETIDEPEAGKSQRTSEEIFAVIDYLAKDARQIVKDYPPKLVVCLRDNLQEHLYDRLKAAGMQEEMDLLGDTFRYQEYLDRFTRLDNAPDISDWEDPEHGRFQAENFAQEFHRLVPATLRLMAEDGKLEAWI